MKEENEMKKAFLERYWSSEKIQESIWDEIRELKHSFMIPGINMDGMPHGASSSDLSSYAVQFDRLKNNIKISVHQPIQLGGNICKSMLYISTHAENPRRGPGTSGSSGLVQEKVGRK